MIVCSPQLGLSPDSILGGEVFDREILLGLARNGIRIEVIMPKGSPHDKKTNINFTFLPLAHFPAFLFNVLVFPYLFKVNAKNKIGILRLHQPQFTALAALGFKVFNPKVKIIATYHQFRETNFGAFSKFLIGKWDHIVCDSTVVKNKIHKQFNVSHNKITVVHNGTPRNLKPGEPDKNLISKYHLEDKQVLLFMGFFIERKNPLFLLKVLQKIIKKHPNTILVYLGKGPLRKKIAKQAKLLKIYKSIRILEPVFGQQKNKIHNLSSIFVHPALDEGFALAPLEAMACAKPVIMNNSHSSAEAVKNGYNGYLCKTNDVRSWSKTLQSLLEDEDKRKTLGKNAALRAKDEFNWDIAVNKHLKMFKKLLPSG